MSGYSSKWFEAMEDETESMGINYNWDLVEIPDRVTIVRCKWVYKTKHNSREILKD